MNSPPTIESVYVGLVEETGSLFTMSPERFPLVVFNNANFNQERLIDPPPGMEPDSHSNMALPYDSDSETTLSPEKCWNGSPNRKCLTGIRPLEPSSESRLSRLLDGAPSVPPDPRDSRNSHPSNSGAVPADSRQPIHGQGNASAVPLWLWDVVGMSQSDPGTFLGVEGTTSVLLARTSFIGALLLGVAWMAAKTIWAKKLTQEVILANKDNSPLLDETAASSNQQGLDLVDTPQSSHPQESPALKGTSLLQINTSMKSPDPRALQATPFAASQESADITRTSSTKKADHTPIDLFDDNDGEESDKDGDIAATPGKRKGRRGKRGKKKKVTLVIGEDGEDEKENLTNGKANGHTGVSEPEVKALVDDPPPTGLIFPSTPKPAATASSLVVSDTVLGMPDSASGFTR